MNRTIRIGLVFLALWAPATACESQAPVGASDDSKTGTITLALSGQGSLGGQYQLSNATFTLTGPVTVSVAGDPSTITQTLPAGTYTVKLESGWTLTKVSDGGASAVTATLASVNPQTVVVTAAQTTNVSWVFNVSGTNPKQDDLEVVAVTVGTMNMAMAGAEVGWANIATGYSHGCGITIPGQLKCWGNNTYGQLGYGDTTARLAPSAIPVTVAVGSGRTVKRVVVGKQGFQGSHSCALLDDNTVKCWGPNTYGQLGYGDTTNRSAPPATGIDFGANTVKTITAGTDFTCAILDTSAVKCWGNNNIGQLGYGDTTVRTSPPANPINLGAGSLATSIEAGATHACALLADGTVKCWGNNGFGQLGYGDVTTRNAPDPSPVNLGTGRTAQSLVAGAYHTCAILDDGSVRCWGFNQTGQLGYGDTDMMVHHAPGTTPVNLGAGRTAKRLAASYWHTCAILDDTTVKCWGDGAYGELGLGDGASRYAPPALTVDLGTGRVATRLVADDKHTCALLDDNAMKCWGLSGAFGTGISPEIRGSHPNDMGDNMPEVLP